MSITQVRPYFRTILNDLGFNEHRDFINIENIPSTLTDKSYHLESEAIGAGAADHQTVYTYNYRVMVRIFRHAYNDPVGTLEQLEIDVDEISCQVLKSENRLESVLLDVVPDVIRYKTLAASNDNYIVAEIPFFAKIKIIYT